jgi:antitoxin ParD1/3/4
MNIALPPDLENLVAEKIRHGLYRDESEVVHEGLRLLRERDQAVDSLRHDIEDGFRAVESGDYTDFDENGLTDLADRVKARGLARLTSAE